MILITIGLFKLFMLLFYFFELLIFFIYFLVVVYSTQTKLKNQQNLVGRHSLIFECRYSL